MTAISQLTALGATPANSDLLPITDVSDTSQSANGTTKKVTVAELVGSVVNQKSVITKLDPPFSGVQARGFSYIESTDAGTRKPLLRNWSFDDTTNEAAIGQFLVLQAFTTMTLKIPYRMSGANTSKNVGWVAYVRAISDTDTSIMAKAFGSANTGTTVCPDAAGTLDVASITLTNNDSASAGDICEVWIERNAGVADDATGDANIVDCVWVEYA